MPEEKVFKINHLAGMESAESKKYCEWKKALYAQVDPKVPATMIKVFHDLGYTGADGPDIDSTEDIKVQVGSIPIPINSSEHAKKMPVFKFYDEHGLSFDIIAVMLKEKGLVPDWEDYFNNAVKANWGPVVIWNRARELAEPFKWWDDEKWQVGAKMLFMRAVEAAK
jgi:hypothetical protein